ncbi:hypothetical protein [Streptomyces sp. NPDC056670]|uniref:hypothetical protein n=1 Tax=Streptomyces sp. NPDC056670 TaxID=3345904 RepID=UPI00368BFC14
MSTEKRTVLFGPDRDRVGYEEHEWSVWILGMDDLHPQDSLPEALQFAAEHNACFADMRMHDSSQYAPVLHAIVLHHGYAWTQATEHAHQVDCGIEDCGPCSLDRTIPIRCSRCKGEDGPFTDDALCEPCARPMPLAGAM